MSEEKLIKLGFCNKAHGIKGGFLFVLESGNDSVLEDGFEIIIDKEGDQHAYKIKNISFGNKIICYLDGVSDRNTVEQMIPFDIYANRIDFPEEEGEVYLSDLIGFEVVDESGNKVGVVLSFSSNGPQDIIIIQTNKSPLELPFVDQFFPSLDMDKKTITINNPEFL